MYKLVGFIPPIITVDKDQKKQFYLPSILRTISKQC